MKGKVGWDKVNNLLFVTELTLWSDVSSLVQSHTLETHTEPKFRIKIEIFRLKRDDGDNNVVDDDDDDLEKEEEEEEEEEEEGRREIGLEGGGGGGGKGGGGEGEEEEEKEEDGVRRRRKGIGWGSGCHKNILLCLQFNRLQIFRVDVADLPRVEIQNYLLHVAEH